MVLNDKWLTTSSRKKSKDASRQTQLKIQHAHTHKMYGAQPKHFKEGNSEQTDKNQINT